MDEEAFAESIWNRVRARQEKQLAESNARLEKTLEKMGEATARMNRLLGIAEEDTGAPATTPAREIGGASDGRSGQSPDAPVPI
jgi:hypothetical protein